MEKVPVSCVFLGLFLDKSTECLGLSRDNDKPQSSCLFLCTPKGTEADFPWSAQPPYTGGSLNESFLPAEAHNQATAHSPVLAQGYSTQPLGRLPRLRELTEGSSEKDPAGMAHRGWAQETLDRWPGSNLGGRATRKCGSGAQTGSPVMMKL